MAKFTLVCALLLSVALSCPGDKYCRLCTGTKCEMCEYAYLNTDGVCVQPDTTVSNCSSYKKIGDAVICVLCEMGYGVNKDGQCDSCATANCAQCPLGVCIMCNNGSVPTATATCDGAIKCTDNCEICNLSGQCLQCKSGFLIGNAAGQCIESQVSNCAGSVDNKSCQYCLQGYYVADDWTCSRRGISWLLIILIIVGIVLIAGIVFFVIKKRRESHGHHETLVA